MEQVLRSVFLGFKLGLNKNREHYSRIRLNFIGTSYTNNKTSENKIAAIAREYELSEYVMEYSERVDYLDAIQIMQDSNGLIALGSVEPHYTASKNIPLHTCKKANSCNFSRAKHSGRYS